MSSTTSPSTRESEEFRRVCEEAGTVSNEVSTTPSSENYDSDRTLSASFEGEKKRQLMSGLEMGSTRENSDGPRYRKQQETSRYHSGETSRYWSRSLYGGFRSNRSGGPGFNFIPEGPRTVLSLFEWTEGGNVVSVKGTWDNYETLIPLENAGSGMFRAVIPVPEDTVEFLFVVDGVERVSQRYPIQRYPTGSGLGFEAIDVNTRRIQEYQPNPRGNSMISEIDMFSPTQIEEYHAPWLFRLLYLAMFPAGMYYFYWLAARGGNRLAPANWVVFTIAEIFSFISATISLFAMWAPVRRQWRSLDALKPPLDSSSWPTVDVVICHYREPVEQIRQTVRAAMAMDYPAHLFRVIVADDGYFARPKSIEHTELGEDLHLMLASEAHHDPLMDEVILDNGRVEHYTVRVLDDIKRPDCALETHIIDYGPYGEAQFDEKARPRLSLIGRVKPADHHNKAGNINNVLFNSDTDGKLVLFLDSDMKPEPNFLKRTVPLLLRSKDETMETLVNWDSRLDTGIHGGTKVNWELDPDVAFVQTPQRFHNASREDFLATRNSIFYDAIGNGRDGFGLTPFAGTNCLWRREVLSELGGIVYGSVTEDTLTSNKCHANGYISKYACEDLCWGEAPVTAAAAMQQRLRWAKGAVQNGIFALVDLRRTRKAKEKDDEITKFLSFRRQSRSPHNSFVRLMFWLDSTLYPLLGIGAYLYIFVAFYYLITAQPPINPESLVTLTAAFVTYYSIRYLVFFVAYWGVSQTDLLRAMETWFTYVVSHTIGMYEAINPNSKLSWVQNTGEGIRQHWSEWVNIVLVFLLGGGVIFRLVAFLAIDGACRPWNSLGALFFGIFCLRMMWPMTSMSLNERISSVPVNKRNNQGLTIPVGLVMAVLTIGGVMFLASWVDAPCGRQSREITNLADDLAQAFIA